MAPGPRSAQQRIMIPRRRRNRKAHLARPRFRPSEAIVLVVLILDHLKQANEKTNKRANERVYHLWATYAHIGQEVVSLHVNSMVSCPAIERSYTYRRQPGGAQSTCLWQADCPVRLSMLFSHGMHTGKGFPWKGQKRCASGTSWVRGGVLRVASTRLFGLSV